MKGLNVHIKYRRCLENMGEWDKKILVNVCLYKSTENTNA